MDTLCVCKKCGYQWQAKKENPDRALKYIPARCPKCRTRKWSVENKSKYKFSELKVREFIKIHWFVLPNGYPDQNKNMNVVRALNIYSKRSGRKFVVETKSIGLIITRIT